MFTVGALLIAVWKEHALFLAHIVKEAIAQLLVTCLVSELGVVTSWGEMCYY